MDAGTIREDREGSPTEKWRKSNERQTWMVLGRLRDGKDKRIEGMKDIGELYGLMQTTRKKKECRTHGPLKMKEPQKKVMMEEALHRRNRPRHGVHLRCFA